MHDSTNGEVIALDGKSVSHSFDSASEKASLHIVGAWATADSLSLDQVRVAEITAIPKLLETLDATLTAC